MDEAASRRTADVDRITVFNKRFHRLVLASSNNRRVGRVGDAKRREGCLALAAEAPGRRRGLSPAIIVKCSHARSMLLR